MSKQTNTFQAETKELLDLMIHSLYSHREIFLRELISNASDAIEKRKFEALTQSEIAKLNLQDEIRLIPNASEGTLTIQDTGIGMTYDEVTKYIGTIAHSGTKAFLKMKEEVKAQPELIGQFGVGFYSAFMVADKVTLHTQKAGTSEGVFWESEGTGTYTIEKKPRTEGAGTSITLYLKKELCGKAESPSSKTDSDSESVDQNFTSEWTLKSVVKKYSDFVAFPIKMKTTKEVPIKEDKPSDSPKYETVIEDETLNSQKALWLKSSSEVSTEEYNEFYKHISHDWNTPLKTIHFKAEGTMEFTSILYIPSQKPFNYDYRDHTSGLNLYVKRVFIMGDCQDLIPTYLRFLKGVVDSDDLSLNVSREILQKDSQIVKMKKALTNKTLSHLKDLIQNDRENYAKFWTNFGSTLKEGVPTDPSMTEKLQDLFLFKSTDSEKWVTFKEYVERMKPGQKAIYYVVGDSLSALKNSPYLEKVKSKGFEVLLLDDRIDEWVVAGIKTYNEKPLQSITAEGLDLSDESEKEKRQQELKEQESRLKPLIESMQKILSEKVKEIRISDRLVDSPVCLVSSADGASAHLERMMEQMGQSIPKQKRILEINGSHPLFEKMKTVSESQQKDWAEILYDQALLNEGSKIEDPLSYSKKIAQLMINTQN